MYVCNLPVVVVCQITSATFACDEKWEWAAKKLGSGHITLKQWAVNKLGSGHISGR